MRGFTRLRRPLSSHALYVLALLVVLAGVVAALIARHALDQRSSATPEDYSPPIAVTVEPRRRGPVVPQGFVGLSFEMSSLPLIAGYSHSGDFVALLRSLGPGVMRFGGISADWTSWIDKPRDGPLWPATTVTNDDLRLLASLTREAGWQVLLGLDLVHYEPQAAASEVAEARRNLRARLAGVEIGNEPNAYGHHGLRLASWSFSQYQNEIEAYRQLIDAAAPGVALAGPDVSGSGGRAIPDWVRPEALQTRPSLLTGHYYSLGCHDAHPPSITRLLDKQTREGMERSLAAYASVSHATGIPFRVDEANSVSCGGQAGVSNNFASALWAVEFIVHAMASGVVGVNLHGHLENCGGYAPLCATTRSRLLTGQLHPQPEWYALLFTKPLVGDSAVQVKNSPRNPHIDITAFASRSGGVHIVIVNSASAGGRAQRILLRVPGRHAHARATILAAPSLEATSDVTLGGRTVAGNGTWAGPSQVPVELDRGSEVSLSVEPCTATLISLY